MKKRMFLQLAGAVITASTLGLAQAQVTPIKFQLDWRFEGPSALFLTPAAKGYSRMPSLTSLWMQAMARAALSHVWPLAPMSWALPTWLR